MNATDPARIFAINTAKHVMSVLHEDGLYRHIRFAKPGTSMYHFDLVTWPGHLSISGDMDGYVFSRIADMFEFFRAKTINPDYWSEKLTTRMPVKKYSEESFRRQLAEAITDEDEDSYPGLKAYAKQRISDADFDGDFAFEDDARLWLRDFEYVAPNVARSFRFLDIGEWDFRDWDYHFLYACHAIQWGITQYDAAKKAAATEVTR